MALALLVIEIVILIYYPKEDKSKFFIYPQHWGFAFITLAFFLDASLVISRYILQENKKPGKYYKGPSNNYVDQIVLTIYLILTFLVHVIMEWPLTYRYT